VSINVLIVEDEPIPAAYLKSIIEDDNDFNVVAIVDNEKEAINAIHTYNIDIIFMDIMIKGSISGAEAALRISDLKENILIIFMTAYTDKEMVEYAVESHAFAYLLKPYRPHEISATLELAKDKIIHKSNLQQKSNVIKLVDNYTFNLSEGRLFYFSQEIKLTSTEFDLLKVLVENLPNAVNKESILQDLEISELSLRAMLYRLRKRTSPNLIQSVKRHGYILGVS